MTMAMDSPLETQRTLMQQALLDDDVTYFRESTHGLEELLFLGHKGYSDYTDAELESELTLRDIPIPTAPEAE
jgi:hypothetical protein